MSCRRAHVDKRDATPRYSILAPPDRQFAQFDRERLVHANRLNGFQCMNPLASGAGRDHGHRHSCAASSSSRSWIRRIVAVALPSIEHDLGYDDGHAAKGRDRVQRSTFGGLLNTRGGAGDLLGHRRLFIAGLALFHGSRARRRVCALAAAPGTPRSASPARLQGAGSAPD
jgi:hypothetical protein